MKTIDLSTKNFTKLDSINSRNGVALKDCDGMSIAVKKLATGLDVDDKGKERSVGVIVSTDDEYYTTISESACDIIEEAMELVDSGMNLEMRVTKRTSKNDREFIAITVIEK